MDLTNIVVKVTSTCNLNCSYCYVFNKGDLSYKNAPKFMSDDIVIALIERIKKHCDNYKTERILIIFHGGEPLLAGKKFYANFVNQVKTIINNNITKIEFAMQSNGVLLDEDWCNFLNELNINIGVSIDGTQNANKERVFRNNGKNAYYSIINGINQIKLNSRHDANVLSVINVNESPIDIYNHYKSIGISTASFLYLDLNYKLLTEFSSIPQIGNWLIELFDYWYNDKSKDRLTIKPFDIIIHKLLGGEDISNEMFGRGTNGVLTIKTDGAIEPVDSLKICGNGFTKTNLNVLSHNLDEALSNDLVKRYYYAHNDDYLSKKCLNCKILDICGGGQLAHRFSLKNGFDNPSIYCNEIIKIVVHIQNIIFDKLSDSLINEIGIKKLYYSDVIQ